MSDIMTVQGLDLWYGDHQALHDISMNIPEKSITALIGPSGCGKSTFLKTLNRMNDLIPGVKITGCTVHFVEELVDSGPVIIQAAVPANAGEELDDLMNRIHPLEHRIYPQALQWLAEGRLRVEGRQVFLAPADRKTVTPDGPWLVWPPLEEGF